MATTGTNNDIYTKLAQLRRQVDDYVPGKTQIVLLQELESDKFFYSEREINQQQQAVPTKQQKLNTLVANNILGSASMSSTPTSKYHCYHIFCKSINMYRASNYPDLALPTSTLKHIWAKMVAHGYKPKFQQAAKLFNAGRRSDIFPEVDYSIYLRELKLI